MAETQVGLQPPQPEQPKPFFSTVNFDVRPKWDTSKQMADEILRMVGDTKEDQESHLAQEMEKTYGKKEAIPILEHIKKHLVESMARSSYKDLTDFHTVTDLVSVARGILGTPNWKDPSKIPEVRISATWDYLKHKK